jgi:hypothetical protein
MGGGSARSASFGKCLQGVRPQGGHGRSLENLLNDPIKSLRPYRVHYCLGVAASHASDWLRYAQSIPQQVERSASEQRKANVKKSETPSILSWPAVNLW